VFRQAQASLIIQYAHQINQGQTPAIGSPFKNPELWKTSADCLMGMINNSSKVRFIELILIWRIIKKYLTPALCPNGNNRPFTDIQSTLYAIIQ
jgi:hypothetical protein